MLYQSKSPLYIYKEGPKFKLLWQLSIQLSNLSIYKYTCQICQYTCQNCHNCLSTVNTAVKSLTTVCQTVNTAVKSVTTVCQLSIQLSKPVRSSKNNNQFSKKIFIFLLQICQGASTYINPPILSQTGQNQVFTNTPPLLLLSPLSHLPARDWRSTAVQKRKQPPFSLTRGWVAALVFIFSFLFCCPLSCPFLCSALLY